MFNLFKRQKQDIETDNERQVRHTFTDFDRENSMRVRKKRKEIEMLELEAQRVEAEARLREAKEFLLGENEQEQQNLSPELMLMSILAPILAGKNNTVVNSQNTPTITPQNTPQEMSEDDIRGFIAKQDRKFIKLAQQMPKDLVKRKAMLDLHLSENEFEKAYKILCEEF